MILFFIERVNQFILRNKTTSNMKIKEVLKKVEIVTKIYMRDGKFATTAGILDLQPTRVTHWVLYINE